MHIIRLFVLVTIIIFIVQCSKSKADVSNIYKTDSAGQLISGTTDDGQWQGKEFNSSEMNLFTELDTADLSGTMMPTISQPYFGYPNPFKYLISIGAFLTQTLNGQVLVKYVVVNASLNPVQKGAVRVDVITSINVSIPGNFNSGNYRLYFTYSAEGHEHFFKSWGNIQKS